MKKLLITLTLVLSIILIPAVPVLADPPAVNYGSIVSGNAHLEPGSVGDTTHWVHGLIAAGDPFGWGNLGGAVDWVKDNYGVTVGIGQGQNK